MTGERNSAKVNGSEASDDNTLFSLLPKGMQKQLLQNGITVPRLLNGTANEEYAMSALFMVSCLGLWIFPYLPKTPIQFISNLHGMQIFETIRCFISHQRPSTSAQPFLAYSIDKLRCHSDRNNSLSRRFVVALKSKSLSGETTGCIGYTRRIADTMFRQIREYTRLFENMFDYFSNLPTGVHNFNPSTLQEGVNLLRISSSANSK